VTNDFSIRVMVPNDRERIKEIIDLSFSRVMGFFAFHSLGEEGQVLVSELRGEVVGFTKLIDFKIGNIKYGCVLWIAVHPDFRRKGVASVLTAEGTKFLREAGCKALFASVQRRKIGAQMVLMRNGFRRTSFLELWRLFRWRVLQFYRDIWLAPGEVVLIQLP